MSEVIDKLRAARERLIEKDRDVAIELFAEHLYRHVEPQLLPHGSLDVFASRAQRTELFEGVHAPAVKWLFDALEADGDVKIVDE